MVNHEGKMAFMDYLIKFIIMVIVCTIRMRV